MVPNGALNCLLPVDGTRRNLASFIILSSAHLMPRYIIIDGNVRSDATTRMVKEAMIDGC
jgi:hypothetical protein